jgi:hypothetical protein
LKKLSVARGTVDELIIDGGIDAESDSGPEGVQRQNDPVVYPHTRFH